MIEYESYPTLHDHAWPSVNSFEREVDALGGLPEGAVVHWHDETFDGGMYQSGIDVWAPMVCDPAGLDWAWVINGRSGDTQADDTDGSLEIRLARDATNNNGHPAWRPETVNTALEAWASEYARRPELRFAADPTLITPLAVDLEDAARGSELSPKLYTVEDLEATDYQDEVVLDAVRGLPKDTVVAWNDDVTYRDGLYRQDIDVWAPAICEPTGLNQAWQINDEFRDCDCRQRAGLDLVVPRDTTVDGQPAWHPETISEVLGAWAADYAGRRDLRFETDLRLVSPMARRLRELGESD